jgi:hypothetical protein
MAADMCSEDYGLHQQCQWAVGVMLRDASSADCAVIIRSDAFQGLLAAAQEWRPFPPAVEGVAVAFERAFDTITTVVSGDAQRQLVETLRSSPDMKGECRGAINRVRGIVGGGTGTARSRSPAREARSQGRTASRDSQPRSASKRSGVCAVA